jgi:hypothetical protein
MRFVVLSCAIVLATAPSLRGAEPEAELEREAKLAAAHEMVTCAAYYLIGAEWLVMLGNQAGARVSARLAEILLERAEVLGSPDVVDREARSELKRLRASIDYTLTKFEVLNSEYAFACNDAYATPEARLAHWREAVRMQR